MNISYVGERFPENNQRQNGYNFDIVPANQQNSSYMEMSRPDFSRMSIVEQNRMMSPTPTQQRPSNVPMTNDNDFESFVIENI